MPRLDRNGNLIGGTVPNSGSGNGGGGGSGEVDFTPILGSVPKEGNTLQKLYELVTSGLSECVKYISQLKTAEEKEKARENIEVYSKSEVEQLVSENGGNGGTITDFLEVPLNAVTEFSFSHNLNRNVEIEVWKNVDGSLQKNDTVEITRDMNSFTLKTLLPFTGYVYYR